MENLLDFNLKDYHLKYMMQTKKKTPGVKSIHIFLDTCSWNMEKLFMFCISALTVFFHEREALQQHF